MAKKTTSQNNENKTSSSKKRKSVVDLNQFLNEVERRAYEIYEERKKEHIHGDEIADWFQAEEEIKIKYRLD